MRIIIISADEDYNRSIKLATYVRDQYNVVYLFAADNRLAMTAKNIINSVLMVDSETVPNLNIKIKRSAKVNYEETKHLLTDIDLSTRSELYKKICEKSHTETDEQLNTKLTVFYNLVLEKLELFNSQSYESINLSGESRDIAVVCDHFIANSIVEAIYKINKYHAYSRTKVVNINKIHANISVINTKTNLLEFYNYSNFSTQPITQQTHEDTAFPSS